MSGLRFPKEKTKKKRKQHTASILQEKDGTCYLCRLLGDESKKQVEEHHIFGGPNRAVSEAGEEYRYQEETLLKGHGEKSIMLLTADMLASHGLGI